MLFLELIKTSKDIQIKENLFKPIHNIIYVTNKSIDTLYPDDITIDFVGEKAFGLSCIPENWTLPFIVISDTFIKEGEVLSEAWTKNIYNALDLLNISDDNDIIVRSSSTTEGLNDRGELYSFPGKVNNLNNLLSKCFQKISSDDSIKNHKLPLIIQKYIVAHSEKGHLSNERRLNKDKRDWKYELEGIKHFNKGYSALSIRNWRKEFDIDKYKKNTLFCNVFDNLKEILKIPASWITDKKLRIHFEWVWDGTNIYLVQADEECNKEGIKPTDISNYNKLTDFNPQVLIKINQEYAEKYSKIKNVLIYQKLNLPIAPLYILDNIEIIKQLAEGTILEDLHDDIKALMQSSLIIRMDIDADSKIIRQSLPRKEFYDLTTALNWLIKQCVKIKEEGLEDKIIFIFHNFIPAISSAFAYASPNERKVQIEALWGLPEGLYFNAHDKYIVDTKNTENIDNFDIHRKIIYKHYLVSADADGNWSTNVLQAPFDWKDSVGNDKWLKQIALDSKRIAIEENKSLSIMWFVNVPKEVCITQVFPWHHEDIDLSTTNMTHKYRKKTHHDKSFTIYTNDDLEYLRNEAKNEISSITRIHIQPKEDSLLRNKHILQEIGELSKKIDAVIVLEGGTLSHAYYQLMKTDAIIELSHSFGDFEDKQEFNKLVRDKIPENIESGGEVVNTAKLTKISMIRALKDKLIEEAFEVFDSDEDSLLGELADVSEVIDGILHHLNIDKKELLEKQKQKYEKVGGFKEGLILLDTENPIPTLKEDVSDSLFKDDIYHEHSSIDYEDLPTKKIHSYKDKRELIGEDENLIRLTIPMTQDSWNTTVMDLDLSKNQKTKLQLSGKRLNSLYQVKLSVFTKKENKQLVIEFE